MGIITVGVLPWMDIGYMERNYHEIILAIFVSVFIMTNTGVLNVITPLKDYLYGNIVPIVEQRWTR